MQLKKKKKKQLYSILWSGPEREASLFKITVWNDWFQLILKNDIIISAFRTTPCHNLI